MQLDQHEGENQCQGTDYQSAGKIKMERLTCADKDAVYPHPHKIDGTGQAREERRGSSAKQEQHERDCEEEPPHPACTNQIPRTWEEADLFQVVEILQGTDQAQRSGEGEKGSRCQ